MEIKQVIVLRKDLNLSKGKLISQACHASLGAYLKTPKKIKEIWEREGSKKIVVEVSDEKALLELYKLIQATDIKPYLVKDAGRTKVSPGTITALGMGPAPEKEIDKITRNLKLL